MRKIILLAGVALTVASCANASAYKSLKRDEYQLAGHPYKSVKDCKRTAPVGKFDRRCDVPVVGFRNFSDPTIGVQAGTPGGFGIGGM
ncbi:hypothetical protein HJA82_29490 [Rhizobium bangladeshense]|uniref:hypothetical protein n=1 Tax=Rhizobium bangladeshense TaxID=1138189 RepID=UPI001C82CE1E|nr:hypothetical protein [Rhizobium bangladeshense]MBX4911450.1 hypothetical protein [Rhizobium bangladeshense]